MLRCKELQFITVDFSTQLSYRTVSSHCSRQVSCFVYSLVKVVMCLTESCESAALHCVSAAALHIRSEFTCVSVHTDIDELRNPLCFVFFPM